MTAPVVTAEHLRMANALVLPRPIYLMIDSKTRQQLDAVVARAIAAAEHRGREAGIREAAEVVRDLYVADGTQRILSLLAPEKESTTSFRGSAHPPAARAPQDEPTPPATAPEGK